MVSGRDVTGLPPERRGVGIVYQDCALFPHLSVEKNIHYGLRYHNGSNSNGRARCRDLVERLGLADLLDRSVTTLSGGEKQRVALARALATAPSVLLLDEPLASLDPCFREEIRDLFRSLHQETGITVLMVTHDFTDAHTLAQRVAILHDGRIEQTGTAETVFRRPATTFVADFVGMRNVLPVRVENGVLSVDSLNLAVARSKRPPSLCRHPARACPPAAGKSRERRRGDCGPHPFHRQPGPVCRTGRGGLRRDRQSGDADQLADGDGPFARERGSICASIRRMFI
jgi:molybdate/tungstate transport system ATP-binding protein